ncbi:hypothetical protein CFC21_020704 [Triticum aestivum]|uniref:Uncharacterized protein n=2 Tax=Triticum aestivum TaxID=4565 RepID=A0A3B6BX41_WHEAT|nr:hypothetical protein CFC21_020704 [Triticum aestivum]
MYLLALNSQGGNVVDFDWATHASNYWVCDGIIGGQDDKAWEAGAALHKHICIEDYSSNALPSFGQKLVTPQKQWILARDNFVVHPESTSFFLDAVASRFDPPSWLLPNDMFHQAENLHVLKLCHCTFSFSSPPFHCCHNLRFLGLDSCQDQRLEEDKKEDTPTMVFCKSLWVIDICNTYWVFPSSREIVEQMAANIREVHIKNGRFLHINVAWGQLQNLLKLRVMDPTWETGGKDEFTVLPNLSRSTNLKALVLNGCFGLEHVDGLPLSLESFSLDIRPRDDDSKEAKISRISLAGCVRLSDFTLCGSLPNLEELDLSGTKVKTLDLTTEVVEVPCLQRVMMLGCEQLRAVLWPEKRMPKLSLLCIDTRGEGIRRMPPDSEKLKKGHCQAYVAMMDMKFIQILTQTSNINMFWSIETTNLSLNICISASGQWCNKDKMGSGNCGNILGPSLPKSLIPNQSYSDFSIDNITIDHGYNSAVQFQPSTCHVEIGEGIINTSMESTQGNEAIYL